MFQALPCGCLSHIRRGRRQAGDTEPGTWLAPHLPRLPPVIHSRPKCCARPRAKLQACRRGLGELAVCSRGTQTQRGLPPAGGVGETLGRCTRSWESSPPSRAVGLWGLRSRWEARRWGRRGSEGVGMRMIAVADSLPRWAEAELRWGRGDTGVVRGEGRTSVLVFFSFLSASPKNPPLCLRSSAFPPEPARWGFCFPASLLQHRGGFAVRRGRGELPLGLSTSSGGVSVPLCPSGWRKGPAWTCCPGSCWCRARALVTPGALRRLCCGPRLEGPSCTAFCRYPRGRRRAQQRRSCHWGSLFGSLSFILQDTGQAATSGFAAVAPGGFVPRASLWEGEGAGPGETREGVRAGPRALARRGKGPAGVADKAPDFGL